MTAVTSAEQEGAERLVLLRLGQAGAIDPSAQPLATQPLVDRPFADRPIDVVLQISTESGLRLVEITGQLPAPIDLLARYDRWRELYQSLGLPTRLDVKQTQPTASNDRDRCLALGREVNQALNAWLESPDFQPVYRKILEQLQPCDRVRLLLQIADPQLRRLPWHQWDLLDRYPRAELAMAMAQYERGALRSAAAPEQLRILAVLGDRRGINIDADAASLGSLLPEARIQFLVEPDLETLHDSLWQPWDILFFAGHSLSRGDLQSGLIAIGPDRLLSLEQLRYGLRRSIDQGLRLAIFNSCDGLGLAQALMDLPIPQVVVMREEVPDPVAQKFLTYFLSALAEGLPVDLAVRQGRERLQGLDDYYPGAAWLPILCQNPAQPSWSLPEPPPTEDPPQGLTPIAPPRLLPRPIRSLVGSALAASLATIAMIGLRATGWLEPLELQALDTLIQQQPAEAIDRRILIIGITEADLNRQGQGGSLGDRNLMQLLDRLNQAAPRVIGLDLYRPIAADPAVKGLGSRLRNQTNLIFVCKTNDAGESGIAPPPEVPPEWQSAQVGFSDFIADRDGVLRRQILFQTPSPASQCATPYSFSSQLAAHYLNTEGIGLDFTADRDLRFQPASKAPKATPTVLHRLGQRSGGYQGIEAGGAQVMLHYRKASFDEVSLSQVLQGQIAAEALRDRLVLIGVTAPSASDRWITPFGRATDQQVPGVQIQAQFTSQLLSAVLDRRALLRPVPWGYDLLYLWLAAGAAALVRWRWRGGALVGLALGVSLGCHLALGVGLWLAWVPTIGAIGLGALLGQSVRRGG
jgi:CHASE2 domain-containing sensor protein